MISSTYVLAQPLHAGYIRPGTEKSNDFKGLQLVRFDQRWLDPTRPGGTGIADAQTVPAE